MYPAHVHPFFFQWLFFKTYDLFFVVFEAKWLIHMLLLFFSHSDWKMNSALLSSRQGLSNVSWSEIYIYIYIKEWIQSPWYGIEALICYRVSRSQTSKKIKQISDLFWNSSRYSRKIFIMLFRHPYLWANPKEIPIRKLETHTHTHREGGGRETKKERYRPAFFLLGMQTPRYHRFISCYTRIHHEVTSLKTAYDNS